MKLTLLFYLFIRDYEAVKVRMLRTHAQTIAYMYVHVLVYYVVFPI